GDGAFFALFQGAEASGVTGHRENADYALFYCRINSCLKSHPDAPFTGNHWDCGICHLYGVRRP
ncbi:hypothetical protein, partial [Azotobacter salinestris]